MAWLDRLGHMLGECHSHTLYSNSCDHTQSTVNGQTTQTGAVTVKPPKQVQSMVKNGSKKMINIQIPVRNGPRLQCCNSL